MIATAACAPEMTTLSVESDGVAVLTAETFSVAGKLALPGIPNVKVELEALQTQVDACAVPASVDGKVAAAKADAIASCGLTCDLSAQTATLATNKQAAETALKVRGLSVGVNIGPVRAPSTFLNRMSSCRCYMPTLGSGQITSHSVFLFGGTQRAGASRLY